MKEYMWQLVFVSLLCLLMLSGCGLWGDGSANSDQQTVDNQEAVSVEQADEQGGIIQTGQGNGRVVGASGVFQALPSPLPAPGIIDPPTGPNYASGATVSHEVEPYEWLHQVTRCYGASYQEVRNANPSIVNPDYILPEQVVTVPNIGSVGPIIGPRCVQQHVVAPGETFYGLARMYQTEPEILQKANPGPLWAGDVILVPAVAPGNVAPPAISQSLVFNLDGDLAVWRNTDARVEVYGDASAFILDMVTHGNGRFILVKQTRNQGASLEIALIDRISKTQTIVETNLPLDQTDGSQRFRPTMLVSPNGTWAAYLVRENGTMRLSTFPTNNPGDLRHIADIPHGVMELGTPQLFAGGDDGHFLMLDDTGIYEYPYALDAGENRIVEIVANSNPLMYEAVTWSPTSGHLLLKGFYIEGSQYFVLDKNSGSLAPLPGSGGYLTNADASWLRNGNVAVISFPGANEAGPVLTVYRPESTPTTLSLAVVSKNVLTIPGYVLSQPGFNISAPPIQSLADNVDFTLIGAGAASGYWMVEIGGTSPGRLNRVPESAFGNYWTTDGSGLLMEQGGYDRPWELVYVPMQGTPRFSLSNWLGIKISQFSWVTQ